MAGTWHVVNKLCLEKLNRAINNWIALPWKANGGCYQQNHWVLETLCVASLGNWGTENPRHKDRKRKDVTDCFLKRDEHFGQDSQPVTRNRGHSWRSGHRTGFPFPRKLTKTLRTLRSGEDSGLSGAGEELHSCVYCFAYICNSAVLSMSKVCVFKKFLYKVCVPYFNCHVSPKS